MRVINWRPLLLLLGACLLSACSSAPPQRDTVSSQGDALLSLLLQQEYEHWAGSPYRLGGSTRKGVDCSSLVQQVLKESVNIALPRTTTEQAKRGKKITKHTLLVGDLVFFKTGWKTRHVGIYMGEQQFMHASTTKGVILSDLNNPYWASHYWQSRRVIN